MGMEFPHLLEASARTSHRRAIFTMKAFLAAIATCIVLGAAHGARLPDDGAQFIDTVSTDPVPEWPRLFSIDFNETSVLLFKRTTEGIFPFCTCLRVNCMRGRPTPCIWRG